MKIFVKVKPKAKKTLVQKMSETRLNVFVKEAPAKGKANQAVLKAVADYFDIAPSRITIAAGSTSTLKVLEIF